MDMPYAQLQMKLGLGCRLDDGPVFGLEITLSRNWGFSLETTKPLPRP